MSQLEHFDGLVELFNSSAKLIRDHLALEQVRNYPEFGAGRQSTAFPLASAPENVRNANKSMFEAMAKIQQTFTDPVEQWSQTTINFQHLSCLQWIVHFNIPSRVPLDKPTSYASVAQAAKVPEHQLRHIARMAMTNGLFREPLPNMLGHSPLSAHFATNPLYLETALFQTEVAAPTALRMTEMTCQYNGSEKPNETAHNIALATDLPFFPYLSQNPTIAARLQAGMKFFGGAERTHLQHLVEMFDWAALGEANVVDVGGSTGHASIALAKAFPNLTFTVQDLPIVISKATSTPLPPETENRIQFVSHDFFKPQPAASSLASIFLVRMVVQNHPKTAAETILRNIAFVMKAGARILLNNIILPDPGTVGLRDEALDRAKSMFMMQAMNGADRGEEEFRELVEGCEAGLTVQEVVKCQGSALSLIIVQKKKI